VHTCPRILLTVIISVLTGSAVCAQEPRVSVAVKGGVTTENSEDGLTGTTPALGVTAALAFAPAWRGEVEFWLPGYLNDADGQPKHRDILLSFSAVRLFGNGRARPFVVAGLTITRTEDWFTFCTAERVPGTGGTPVPGQVDCHAPDVIERRRERNTGKDGYALVGSGLEFGISPRVNLVADVRVSLAPVSVLVRPAIGLAVRF
jgi:hypothetical protein